MTENKVAGMIIAAKSVDHKTMISAKLAVINLIDSAIPVESRSAIFAARQYCTGDITREEFTLSQESARIFAYNSNNSAAMAVKCLLDGDVRVAEYAERVVSYAAAEGKRGKEAFNASQSAIEAFRHSANTVFRAAI